MADYQEIATQFVQYYYNKFDSDRSQLASLYRNSSMLTFEHNPSMGALNIIEKLQSLPFQKVRHRIDTSDAQPTHEGILVMVTGALLVDDSQHPMNYVQTFALVKEDNTYFVQNDIFRLVYPSA